MEVNGELHAPPGLPPRKKSGVFNRRLVGPKDVLRHFGEEKDLSLPQYLVRTIKLKRIKWSRYLPHVMTMCRAYTLEKAKE
jgi:hypothetical protein